MTPLLSLLMLITSIFALQKPDVIYRASLNPYYLVYRREFYRLFSHVFVHANWIHLFVNLIVIYSFGRYVEGRMIGLFGNLGIVVYLLLCAVIIVVSSIPSIRKYRFDPAYHSVGASGLASGLVFSAILFNPWLTIWLFFLLPLPAVLVGVVYLAYSWYMKGRSDDFVNHEAHFWGAVAGFLFPLTFKPALLNAFFERLINPPFW